MSTAVAARKRNTTEAIKQLLKIVNDLRNTYKSVNKKFTLYGRLVGDIGEILVFENYDVKLFDKITPKYDGIDSNYRNVQIKTTFHKTLGFPCDKKDIPDYYIGIKIDDREFEEVLMGRGIIFANWLKTEK